MNLCMSSQGKTACVKQAEPALRLLSRLLGHRNKEIHSYVNGALFSLLANGRIRSKAKELVRPVGCLFILTDQYWSVQGLESSVEAVLESKTRTADDEKQLPYVLAQLRGGCFLAQRHNTSDTISTISTDLRSREKNGTVVLPRLSAWEWRNATRAAEVAVEGVGRQTEREGNGTFGPGRRRILCPLCFLPSTSAPRDPGRLTFASANSRPRSQTLDKSGRPSTDLPSRPSIHASILARATKSRAFNSERCPEYRKIDTVCQMMKPVPALGLSQRSLVGSICECWDISPISEL